MQARVGAEGRRKKGLQRTRITRIQSRARAVLPAGEGSWVQWLLWRDWLGTRTPPTVAAGDYHTLFVDKERRLLSCGFADVGSG